MTDPILSACSELLKLSLMLLPYVMYASHQDPYHDHGQAMGLSFSVPPNGQRLPSSLLNIYKELRADCGCPLAPHGHLEKWAHQGVLLLNAILTVSERAQRSGAASVCMCVAKVCVRARIQSGATQHTCCNTPVTLCTTHRPSSSCCAHLDLPGGLLLLPPPLLMLLLLLLAAAVAGGMLCQVREHAPLSHQKRGWEQFTDSAIATLSARRRGLVFMLWGKTAQDKAKLIDASKHHLLMTSHPSGLSVARGFSGSRHFSKANQLLMVRIQLW